jgi:ubiquinone biosynthesis protein
VVVPFTWHDTSEHLRRDGVFKILKPGVEAKLEEEFEIWSALGPYLEDRSRKHGLLELGFRETLASIQRLLRHEVQFEVERKHLGEAARLYDSMEDVHIPRVLPFSSRRITAIERIYGQKVTDAGDLSMSRRQRLGETIIEALLAKPFFTDAAHGIFHFDPHAGNLLLDRKGRLVILDWSLASQLRGQQKRAIVAVLLGALSMDERRIVQALASLSLRHSNATDALDVVSEALREVRWGRFPGVEWLTALLDQLAVGSGVTFPAELTLFRKMLFTVTGVVADVAPAVSVDRVMLHEGLSQFCRELGPRMITSDQHEHFDTHVSNQELLTLWSTLPLTMQRYWINAWLDALEARP